MSKSSETIVSHVLVFPNDSNATGNMFGGRIMEFMDSCAAIAAGRFATDAHYCVTASVENIQFRLPVHVGDDLKFTAQVAFTGRTSMVIRVDVYRSAKGQPSDDYCTSGHLVFVAMDARNRPVPVPTLEITSDREQRAWQTAKAVRERLLQVRAAERQTDHG